MQTARAATAVVMLVLRTVVIGVGMATVFAALVWAGSDDALVLALTTGTAMTVVANLVSLVVLVRLTRTQGQRLGALVGFSWRRLPRDVCWGLLWLVVLNTPFILVITALTFAIYRPAGGDEVGAAFEQVFAGRAADAATLSVDLPLWYGVVVAVSFALLNPVVEEMHYRAWLQPAWIVLTRRTWAGIVVSAAGFGVQHLFYGWTFTGSLIYVAAFFVWGLTAGVIYYRQRRLVPLVVSHFLVNAPFATLPVVLG